MEKNILMTLANGIRLSWYIEDNINIIQIDGSLHKIYGEIRINIDTLEVIYSNNGFGFISEEDYINFVIRNKEILQELIHYIQSKKQRNQTEKEYIEYALDRYGRIVHIDEVLSGIKCGCTCIACGESLSARHGNVSKHSFKHTKGKDCIDGYRQSLALKLRKQLEEAKVLKWPDEIFDMKALREDYTTSIKIEGPEYKIINIESNTIIGELTEEVVIDLLITTIQGKKIAIYVYNKEVDREVVNKLRGIGIPALMISQSSIDRMEFELIHPINIVDLIYKLETYATWRKKDKAELCIRNGIENNDIERCKTCEYKCYMDDMNIICSLNSGLTCNQLIVSPITKAIAIREDTNLGLCPECGGDIAIRETKKFNRKFIGHKEKYKYKECTWLIDTPDKAVSMKREQELLDALKRS